MTWYDTDYDYKKKITIDNTKVAGNETDFPVLISITDADLADTGNGGHVQNSNGYDIIFTDSTETTQLKHEMERYVNTSGLLVYWVKINSLSSVVNTDIYIYYGKTGVVADPSSTDTWDANFIGVYHMGDIAGDCHDSTSNSNDGTYYGNLPTRIAGSKCGWAQDFDGSGDTINLPIGCHVPIAGTYEVMLRSDTDVTAMRIFEAGDGGDWRQTFTLRWDASQRHDINWKYTVAQEWVDANPQDPDTDDHYYVVAFESGHQDWFRDLINMNGATITTANFAYNNLYIGSANNGTTSWFEGQISELRVSNIKRSDNWLNTTYNTQFNPDTFVSWGEEEEQPAPPTEFPLDHPLRIIKDKNYRRALKDRGKYRIIKE